jgi:hypothetical protein
VAAAKAERTGGGLLGSHSAVTRWISKQKIFRSTNPRRIALSLKRSAEHSKRRKGTPYQSATSMLNFYINRAGRNLPQKQKRVLERAKDELRDLFGRR